VTARTVDLDHGRLVISRAELLDLAAGAPGAFSPEERDRLAMHAMIVGDPICTATVTRVRPGEVRRVDVWLSPYGLIGQPRQLHDDGPARVFGAVPADTYSAMARILALRAELDAASIACPRWSFTDLVQGVHDDSAPGAAAESTVSVVEWFVPRTEHSGRQVVLESAVGRWADLGFRGDDAAALELVPAPALKVFAAVAATVGAVVGERA